MISLELVGKAVRTWLHPNNELLQGAVSKTVDNGLFSLQDIELQLNVLRKNVENGDIHEWVKRSGLNDEHNAKGRKVLCLHAGNLPLVGFQTALGVVLSGADYHGKLSRKDPHLLASFLEELKKSVPDLKINYSTDLNAFKNLQADKVVFAGSEQSVPAVKDEIKTLKAAKADAQYIIRTAKFSITYLSDWNKEIKRELAEATLRYGGNGCRSVAVVVAPFSLDEIREELEQSIRSFWNNNPPHQKPNPDLKYLYAYNMGIQRNQLWLGNFLIQETEEIPETDFTVNWVEGNKEKVRDLRISFGQKVQTVYTCGEDIKGLETEPLRSAQRPPLYWKPDGVDVMEVLAD